MRKEKLQWFCDKCGKEIFDNNMVEVNIDVEMHYCDDYYYPKLELCKECAKPITDCAKEIIEKLEQNNWEVREQENEQRENE